MLSVQDLLTCSSLVIECIDRAHLDNFMVVQLNFRSFLSRLSVDLSAEAKLSSSRAGIRKYQVLRLSPCAWLDLQPWILSRHCCVRFIFYRCSGSLLRIWNSDGECQYFGFHSSPTGSQILSPLEHSESALKRASNFKYGSPLKLYRSTNRRLLPQKPCLRLLGSYI